MILDERAEFADATTIPTATGRSLLGDVYDLQVARDVGLGTPMFLVIQITTAVTSAGAATVAFELVSDAAAAIATDGSATQHASSFAVPKATLIAGYQLAIPVPPENPSYERFIGVLSNVGVAALTAGAANAFLVKDVARWKAYADAVN